MAISANCVGEVRANGTPGNDNNGGFFKAGATGTDYSQQASPQWALTGIASAGSGNVVLYAGAAATMIGNCVNVVSGTNYNTGIFEITSVSVGVSFTCGTNAAGNSICTGVGAAGVMNIGGALATIGAANNAAAISNQVWLTGSETHNASTTISLGTGYYVTGTQTLTRFIGYGTSRGDNGQFIIALGTTSSLTGIIVTGSSVSLENIYVNCNSLTGSNGINVGTYNRANNLKVSNFKGTGLTVGSATTAFGCEVTGGISGATAATSVSTQGSLLHSHIHENSCTAVAGNNGVTVANNLIVNNTGSTSDGINGLGYGSNVLQNVIYNSGRHGLVLLYYPYLSITIKGNIIVSNGSYGTYSPSGLAANILIDGNAYYNNTGGNRYNVDDTGTANPINASSPYTNIYDVILTASPFNSPGANPATADWGLNATAGGGAACRNAFGPGTWPGNTTTRAHNDFGPVQHADAGGAALLYVGDGVRD